MFVGDAARQIPLGIGVVEPSVSQTPNGPFASATHCYYWLHTHAADGIIHVESPSQHTYTLGDFFDIWRQPLSANQVGPATGTVTAFVNGAKYNGDPRAIPLGSRTDIQLDVGSPAVSFQAGRLVQGAAVTSGPAGQPTGHVCTGAFVCMCSM